MRVCSPFLAHDDSHTIGLTTLLHITKLLACAISLTVCPFYFAHFIFTGSTFEHSNHSIHLVLMQLLLPTSHTILVVMLDIICRVYALALFWSDPNLIDHSVRVVNSRMPFLSFSLTPSTKTGFFHII